MRVMSLRSPGKLCIETPVLWRTRLAKLWANHSSSKLQPSMLRLDNFTSYSNLVRLCPLVWFIPQENSVCVLDTADSHLFPLFFFFNFSTNRAKWDLMGKNWYPRILQKSTDMGLWPPPLLPQVRGFPYFFCFKRTITELTLVLCSTLGCHYRVRWGGKTSCQLDAGLKS